MATGLVADSIRLTGLSEKDRINLSVNESGEIYALIWDKNNIEKFDREGMLIRNYFYNDANTTLYALYYDLNISKNNHVFLYEHYSANGIEFCKYPIWAEYVVNDSTNEIKRIRHFGEFPAPYKRDYYDEYYPSIVNIDSVTNAYLFGIAPKLYVEQNGRVASHTVTGMDPCIYPPVKDNNIRVNYLDRAMETTSFIRLLYSRTQQIFFIFQLHPIPDKKKDGEMALYKDAPFTIYAVDKNFKVIARKDFAAMGNYELRKAGVMGGKLYLPVVDQDKLTMQFQCYELQSN